MFEPIIFLNSVTFPFMSHPFQFIIHNIYNIFRPPDVLVKEIALVDLSENDYKYLYII
jgi:hypothetical protein